MNPSEKHGPISPMCTVYIMQSVPAETTTGTIVIAMGHFQLVGLDLFFK